MFRSRSFTSILSNSLVAVAAGFVVFCSQAHAEFVTTPGGVSGATGNTVAPFSNRGDTNGNRFQQVYSSSIFSAVGPLQSISAVAFYPRQGTFGSFISDKVSFSEIMFRLSTTSRNGDFNSGNYISGDLDLNAGPDEAIVFSGHLDLSGHTGGFDYLVNFDTPFLYSPSAGNLLLEVLIPNGATVSTNGIIGYTQLGNFIESTLGDDGFASATDADLSNDSSPFGSIGSNSSSAVVTQFTTNAVVAAPVPEPASVTIWCALTALATTLRVRSRDNRRRS
ncbi:MAG: hypothetical protein ABI557_07490 [Aureliella sp.]